MNESPNTTTTDNNNIITDTSYNTNTNTKVNTTTNSDKKKKEKIEEGIYYEINTRINNANRAWGSLQSTIFRRRDITITTKLEVYRISILPVLLYGSEAWTINKNQLNSLEVFHRKKLRKIINKTLFDHVSNKDLHILTNIPTIACIISRNRWHFFGKCMHMDISQSWVKQVMSGRVSLGSRGRGKPKLRWSDLVKQDGRTRLEVMGLPEHHGENIHYTQLAYYDYKNRNNK